MFSLHTLRLPHPAYLRTVILRSALMWLLVRLFMVAALWVVIGFEAALHQPSLGVPALLVWLDRRFFREQLLPANLGASEFWFWTSSLTVVLSLDLLAAVLLART